MAVPTANNPVNTTQSRKRPVPHRIVTPPFTLWCLQRRNGGLCLPLQGHILPTNHLFIWKSNTRNSTFPSGARGGEALLAFTSFSVLSCTLKVTRRARPAGIISL